ncbi:MAG TPA: prolyl oligopeptidase family serine peptidase [Pirellulales bacterium]|jgi:predicted esterase
MSKAKLPIAVLSLTILILAILALAPVTAQITPDDARFGRLNSSSMLMPYKLAGGDTSQIMPLLESANQSVLLDPVNAYRGYTHALVLIAGKEWTPETELTTALDFSIQKKVLAPKELLQTRVTFLFDAPAAAGPYRLALDILASDGTKVAAVEPGIALFDVKGRHSGETAGLIFDPSKLVGPGTHLLRATLKNGEGADLFEYFRTFVIVKDLNKRLAASEQMLELLGAQQSPAALTARYLLETIKLAHQTYLGGNFQNLTGYLHSAYRRRGNALFELMDFDAELERAGQLAAALKDGRDPLADARGDLRLAYRSNFDGKLVPYRLYLPKNYDQAKAYPLIALLHGAGGDENNFFDRYEKVWPKLAEERGYIIVAANGRGPTSNYLKENGAQQDVLDVISLMQANYHIDPARLYLAGHSMGSAGTWFIGLEHRDRFAALAPIAGSKMLPFIANGLNSGRKIPLIIVAGVKDAIVPVADCREVAEKAKELGFDVKYLEYADGDHMSVAISSVKEIFDWFDSHRLTSP